MSSQSPREAAATEAAQTNYAIQQNFTNFALPGIQAALASIQNQLGDGGLNRDVHGAFENARTDLNQNFAQASASMGNLTRQQALQSGEVYQPSQITDAIALQGVQLEKQRVQGLRNLQFQEAQAGLAQYNQLMNLLGQGSGAAFNLGRGFSSTQAAAIGGMNNQDPWQGALGGAASGASLGGSVGGGWGAAIGAVGGGLAGYFGSGGG